MIAIIISDVSPSPKDQGIVRDQECGENTCILPCGPGPRKNSPARTQRSRGLAPSRVCVRPERPDLLSPHCSLSGNDAHEGETGFSAGESRLFGSVLHA